MSQKAEVFAATGRRKSAVARVRLSKCEGKAVVNERDFREFFPTEAVRSYIQQPFALTNTLQQFDFVASVSGGGNAGQAGAVRHAISRALVLADAAHKDALKSSGCLTRDPREKERKKPGRPGARRRFQFSKR